jgi:hypothetical protein
MNKTPETTVGAGSRSPKVFGGRQSEAKYPQFEISEDDASEGWCDVVEACSLLANSSPAKLIRLVRAGLIPTRRIGRSRVYPRKAIKRLVASGGLDGR